MMTVSLVLILLALLCFFLAAIDVSVHPRLRVGWLGLFFVTLAQIIKV
jgi:hypothetical protein